MPTEILMPALSPTMEEGKLVKWHVGEGDAVRAGDVIAEIETDKATMEVEAVDDGRIGKLLVPEGTEHVKVNRPIALLLVDGEATSGTVNQPEAAAPTSPRRNAGEPRVRGLRPQPVQRPPHPNPLPDGERGLSRHPISARCLRLWRRHRRALNSPRSSLSATPKSRPAPRRSP